mmetsp:Transcript_30353/g.99124  ORF Transcript_30353/g.99124 Transcript_30353/m.99124 type:complete len:127 (+) Transcript_30353:194-574(+)
MPGWLMMQFHLMLQHLGQQKLLAVPSWPQVQEQEQVQVQVQAGQLHTAPLEESHPHGAPHVRPCQSQVEGEGSIAPSAAAAVPVAQIQAELQGREAADANSGHTRWRAVLGVLQMLKLLRLGQLLL